MGCPCELKKINDKGFYNTDVDKAHCTYFVRSDVTCICSMIYNIGMVEVTVVDQEFVKSRAHLMELLKRDLDEEVQTLKF